MIFGFYGEAAAVDYNETTGPYETGEVWYQIMNYEIPYTCSYVT